MQSQAEPIGLTNSPTSSGDGGHPPDVPQAWRHLSRREYLEEEIACPMESQGSEIFVKTSRKENLADFMDSAIGFPTQKTQI